jgi:hypothetical protein
MGDDRAADDSAVFQIANRFVGLLARYRRVIS